MPARRVVAALNVSPGHYDGYRPGDPLALLTSRATARGPILFTVAAADAQGVLDVMWEIGNRSRADEHDRRWPHDVRSLSTGDVLVVYPPGYPLTPGEVETFAVAPVGFDPIPVHGVHHGPWVWLEDTDATSRPATRAGSPRLLAAGPEAPSARRESL